MAHDLWLSTDQMAPDRRSSFVASKPAATPGPRDTCGFELVDRRPPASLCSRVHHRVALRSPIPLCSDTLICALLAALLKHASYVFHRQVVGRHQKARRNHEAAGPRRVPGARQRSPAEVHGWWSCEEDGEGDVFRGAGKHGIPL